MLSPKLRKKLLMKWAQAVAGAPSSPASPTSPSSPASPTSPGSPTTPESTTQNSLGPPPPFDPLGGPWAWIPSVYNPDTVRYLAYLLRTINTVLWYASQGKYDLGKYQNNINGMDESGTGTDNGKNAVLLVKLFNQTFLHNGQPINPPPHPSQIGTWVNTIINSQPLQSLTQLNPTGPAAQQMRLNDSLRQTIVNNLGYIRQSNPVQAGQEQR
jgi:hypothetical protein